MRNINAGYSVGPILRAAILEHIKRNGLTIVKNDDPIDWYKRTYCLQATKPKIGWVSRENYHLNRTPVLVEQTA